MKIISSYKDYYDYLQGIYGVDEKLVLNRQKETPKTFIIDDYVVRGEPTHKVRGVQQYEFYSDFQVVTFAIGDYKIQGMTYQGKILYGEELEFLNVPESTLAYFERKGQIDKEHDSTTNKYYHIDNTYITYKNGHHPRVSVLKNPVKYKKEYSPNIKENSPILLLNTPTPLNNKKSYKSPILSSYRINKVFDPHSMWVLLSSWLGERLNIPIPDNMTNKEKIQAAGFDLKTSFRKM